MKVSRVVALTNKVGIHARPASAFVKVANSFQCEIRVSVPGKLEADGKRLMTLLALNASRGALLTIEADGEDAERAVQALHELVQSKFGEPE